MIVHAAPGDTWGIPGPIFLRLYLVATAVVVVLAVLSTGTRLLAGIVGHRARSTSARSRPRTSTAGPRSPCYAALGGLRGSGAVGVGPDRRLLTTGPAAGRGHPARPGRATTRPRTGGYGPGSWSRDEWVGAALRQLRDGLEERGLAADARRSRPPPGSGPGPGRPARPRRAPAGLRSVQRPAGRVTWSLAMVVALVAVLLLCRVP